MSRREPVAMPVDEARELVKPENLEEILQCLVRWRLILQFEITAKEVLIWERREKRLSALFCVEEMATAQPLRREGRARKVEG